MKAPPIDAAVPPIPGVTPAPQPDKEPAVSAIPDPETKPAASILNAPDNNTLAAAKPPADVLVHMTEGAAGEQGPPVPLPTGSSSELAVMPQ